MCPASSMKSASTIAVVVALAGCTSLKDSSAISPDEAISIAKLECEGCKLETIERDGDSYVINFLGPQATDVPYIGGGGGTVTVSAVTGKILSAIFLE